VVALVVLALALVGGAALGIDTSSVQQASAQGSPLASGATDGSYALVDAAGGVLTYGGAGYAGDTLALTLHKPIVGGAADLSGAGGYWLVASDGGVFAFGDAQFYGSTGGLTLNQPVVGMATTEDGGGYWLVASDGGIFSFGDAQFYGSTGGMTLNKPVVGMASTEDGGGYWLVASDGGIFTFGDAPFDGSMGGSPLNAPITGMSATPDGQGYWLVGQDAGVFTFGDALYSGSAESPLHVPLFPAGFSAPIPPVVAVIPDAVGPEATHQGQLRVAFAGDSNGFYEGQYTLGTGPPYQIDDGAAPGCGYTNGAVLIPWAKPTTLYNSPAACALWAQQLEWVTARFHPDVTIIQVGYWEAQNRLFDGTYQTIASPAYAAAIQANLEQAVQIAHSDGGAVILNTSPYFNDDTPDNLVDIFNQMVQTVAQEYSPYVTVFDAFSLLDPGGAFSTVVDGVVARGDDGVHLTQDGVTTVLVPPLNQLIATVGQPVYNGNA
jgi:lysophospholipase L1-like esterase